MTWMLLLILWTGDSGDEVVVLDYNLTAEDCFAAKAIVSSYVADGDAVLVCEPELTRTN